MNRFLIFTHWNSPIYAKYFLQNTFVNWGSFWVFCWKHIPIIVISRCFGISFYLWRVSCIKAFRFSMVRLLWKFRANPLSLVNWFMRELVPQLNSMELSHSFFHFPDWFYKSTGIFLIFNKFLFKFYQILIEISNNALLMR